MPGDTYAVDGNLEWRINSGFVDVIQNDLNARSVFDDRPPNVRIDKDSSTAHSMPAMGISCLVEQSVPRTNEYIAHIQIACETQADNDPKGEQVDALVGYVRDLLHIDASDLPDRFPGDCRGLEEMLNSLERGVHFHQVHEAPIPTINEDEGRRLRRIVSVDAGCYPGRAAA
jgi:hypothetical protein